MLKTIKKLCKGGKNGPREPRTAKEDPRRHKTAWESLAEPGSRLHGIAELSLGAPGGLFFVFECFYNFYVYRCYNVY